MSITCILDHLLTWSCAQSLAAATAGTCSWVQWSCHVLKTLFHWRIALDFWLRVYWICSLLLVSWAFFTILIFTIQVRSRSVYLLLSASRFSLYTPFVLLGNFFQGAFGFWFAWLFSWFLIFNLPLWNCLSSGRVSCQGPWDLSYVGSCHRHTLSSSCPICVLT